jgi:hypothetical protein
VTARAAVILHSTAFDLQRPTTIVSSIKSSAARQRGNAHGFSRPPIAAAAQRAHPDAAACAALHVTKAPRPVVTAGVVGARRCVVAGGLNRRSEPLAQSVGATAPEHVQGSLQPRALQRTTRDSFIAKDIDQSYVV